jgi:hydrogenase/urease accessory protein HupE
VARTASAHLLPDRRGTLNVVGNAVFAVLAVPVSALHAFDDDGDGRMSVAELNAHQAALRAEVDPRFSITDGPTAGQTVSLDLVLSPPHDGAPGEAETVVALKHVTFIAPPADLRLACDLFAASGADRGLTFTATRHPDGAPAESEAAILTPLASEHRFFRAPGATFADAVRAGIEHILTGFDHLLFLLTLVVAGAGWRYWAGVTTTFTLAHCITLTASALGLVRLSPAVVEPLIALSIVLVAADDLVRRGRVRLAPRMALVFACGLLHGMGFASCLGALDLDAAHRIGTLAGFNAGIEMGQAAFLCAVLGALALGRRLEPAATFARGSRWVTLAAGLTGCVWFVTRLVG